MKSFAGLTVPRRFLWRTKRKKTKHSETVKTLQELNDRELKTEVEEYLKFLEQESGFVPENLNEATQRLSSYVLKMRKVIPDYSLYDRSNLEIIDVLDRKEKKNTLSDKVSNATTTEEFIADLQQQNVPNTEIIERPFRE